MADSMLYPYLAVFVILITPFVFRPGSAFHYHGKFLVFYLYTSLAALCVIPMFALKWRDVDNARKGANIVAQMIPSVIGVDYECRNKEILSEDRGAIIVCNHQTALDILGLFAIWHIPYKLTAVAKKELLYFWPFGLCAWLAGVIFIDRNSGSKAYATLDEAAQLTKKDKVKIWFFPEGTRNRKVNKTKTLLPLKKGAFKMAISCQIPLIPVVFSPYYFLDINTYRFDQGKVIIKTLEPISTTGLEEKDIPDLMKKTASVLEEEYLKLFAEVESMLPPTHPFLTGNTST